MAMKIRNPKASDRLRKSKSRILPSSRLPVRAGVCDVGADLRKNVVHSILAPT
jgi:hypothetical protein